MERNGLTVSMLFEAESANYGEGLGNITVLKKLGRSGGEQYSYISRQALRYNMVQQLGWDNTPVFAAGSGQKKVVQFDPKTSIEEFPEIDLFGYLKTSPKKKKKGKEKEKEETAEPADEEGITMKRAAVVRLSNAIALEPYQGDMDYLTNMGLAARGKLDNAIAQSEIHKSVYAYTMTIDLDRVGIDENDGSALPKGERAKRVKDFLDTVQFLYRDIKGRRENLNPIFAVGGVYARKNPYFENRLKLKGGKLDTALLKDMMQSTEDVHEHSVVGCLEGMFSNGEQIKEDLQATGIGGMFAKLKAEVDAYYE